MYELRLFALEQLSAMRADLFLCDPHRIIVTGPTKLRGRTLDSRDIRSGMALVAAALAAEGESTVLEIETVERGYATLVERFDVAWRAGGARRDKGRLAAAAAGLLRRERRNNRDSRATASETETWCLAAAVAGNSGPAPSAARCPPGPPMGESRGTRGSAG